MRSSEYEEPRWAYAKDLGNCRLALYGQWLQKWFPRKRYFIFIPVFELHCERVLTVYITSYNHAHFL